MQIGGRVRRCVRQGGARETGRERVNKGMREVKGEQVDKRKYRCTVKEDKTIRTKGSEKGIEKCRFE